MLPILSVVVPVYNSELYVSDCLRTILNQSFKDFNVCVVDDGSTDSSNEIIKKIASEDRRIILVKTNHCNAGNARNVGLNYLRNKNILGKYLLFLDSDDLYRHDMFEKLIDNVIKTDSDVCVCGSDLLSGKSVLKMPYRHSINIKFKNGIDGIYSYEPNKIPGNIFKSIHGWTWDKLIKSELIIKYNLEFDKLSAFNDANFTYNALMHCRKICFTKKAYVLHRINVKNSIRDMCFDKPDNLSSMLSNIKNDIESNNFDYFLSSFLDWSLEFILWFIFSTKEKKLKIENYHYFRKSSLLSDYMEKYYKLFSDKSRKILTDFKGGFSFENFEKKYCKCHAVRRIIKKLVFFKFINFFLTPIIIFLNHI